MGVLLSHLAVDCTEPAALARWWADVLGWNLDPEDVVDETSDEVWIGPSLDEDVGGIIFLRVPEDKQVKNRIHLDLRPSDGSTQAEELSRLLALGAVHVDVGQGDVLWHVLADPEGNEFCLLRRTPAELAAARTDAAAEAPAGGTAAAG